MIGVFSLFPKPWFAIHVAKLLVDSLCLTIHVAPVARIPGKSPKKNCGGGKTLCKTFRKIHATKKTASGKQLGTELRHDIKIKFDCFWEFGQHRIRCHNSKTILR